MAHHLLGGHLCFQHGSHPHVQVLNHHFTLITQLIFVREDQSLDSGSQKLDMIASMVLGGIFFGVWFLIKMVYYEILEENKRQRECADTEEISIRTLL